MKTFSMSDMESVRVVMMMYESGAIPQMHTKHEAMILVMRYSKGKVNPAEVDRVLHEYGFND